MSRTYIIGCLVLICSVGYGQAPGAPEPPVITRTTVDVATQHIIVYWAPSPTPTVTYYKVGRWYYTGNNTTASFKPYGSDSIFANQPLQFEILNVDPSVSSQAFKVQAFIDYKHKSFPSDVDSTIFLSGKPDNCEAQLKLSWNIDYSWKGNILSHTIFVAHNGGSYSPVKVVSGDSTHASVSIKQGGKYKVYVMAIRNNAARDSANSQSITIKSSMANIPRFINGDYATVTGNGVKVRFTIDTLSQLTDFELMRTSSLSDPFRKIKTYNSDMDSIVYNDPENTSQNPWYYKVVAINECGNRVDSSNIAGTILLQAQQNGTDVSLNWTPYQKWLSGVKNYDIQRKFGTAAYSTIKTVSVTNYVDHITINQNVGVSSQVTYRIIAHEEAGNPHSSGNNTSISNEVQVELNPNINFNCNAFIPGSASNGTFKLDIAPIPATFSFKIFNRWGNLVFKTTDPYNPIWDGTYQGKTVEQGVYMWQIEYSNGGKKPHVMHGTVTVIVP